LLLLNNTDGVQDATPVLGSLTSLFIGEEIASNTAIITNDYPILNATLRPDVDGNGNPIIVSNISVSAENLIATHLQTASGMLNTRRLHDWNFFANGRTLLEDYNRVDKLENVGNTQTYLINNLIGTDSYKQKISANNS
jgi:hypothetical protein